MSTSHINIIKQYVVPTKILLENLATNADHLLKSVSLQPILGGESGCILHSGGKILLDFSKELQGGIEIAIQNVTNPKSAKLHIVFGESASEAMSQMGNHMSGNHHSIRDTTLPVCFLQRFRFGNSGFRFVRLEAVDGDISIQAIRAVGEAIPRTAMGSFRCSDSLLNDIWETGRYTVELCMQEYLWDGIKRDRLVWVGDMHPEVSTICSVYGLDSCVTQSLDLIRDATPSDTWMNGIPSYTMWWLIIHKDWYLQNGEYAYLLKQKEYIMAVLYRITALVDKDGVVSIDDYFVDWSSKDSPYAAAGMYSVLAMALDAGRELCGWLDEPALTDECEKARARLTLNVPYDGNKQVAALVALSGLKNVNWVNSEYLSKEPLSGLSTFLGYYVLQAREKAGDLLGSLDIVRKYWGKMLELGATTFWEDFNLEWAKDACPIDCIPQEGQADIHRDYGRHCYTGYRHSLCHGWASGPTAFLSKTMSGIKILEPGCRVVSINPNLGDLDWMECSYPTPYGPLKIHSYKAKDGKVKTQVTAPPQVKILSQSSCRIEINAITNDCGEKLRG